MSLGEYTVVKAAKNLSKEVSAGTIGTIVLVYSKENRGKEILFGYEVEFFDRNNNTIVFPSGDITMTVEPDDIENFQMSESERKDWWKQFNFSSENSSEDKDKSQEELKKDESVSDDPFAKFR